MKKYRSEFSTQTVRVRQDLAGKIHTLAKLRSMKTGLRIGAGQIIEDFIDFRGIEEERKKLAKELSE